MNPKLHGLLSIQGKLLDAYLEQNMGERFAYVILVAPLDTAYVNALSNVGDAQLISPVVELFATRISGMKPGKAEILGTPQAHEARRH